MFILAARLVNHQRATYVFRVAMGDRGKGRFMHAALIVYFALSTVAGNVCNPSCDAGMTCKVAE